VVSEVRGEQMVTPDRTTGTPRAGGRSG